MKFLTVLFSITFCLLATLTSHAQQVLRDNWHSLQVEFDTPNPRFGEITIDGQQFTSIALDGYMPSAAVGAPSLPTFSHLIEVPLCKGFEVTVTNATYDTIQLHGAVLMPTQPSRSKSDTTPARIVIDSKIYATDALYGQVEATVEAVGIARNRRLARIQFSPVRYNPVRGQLIVCRHAVVAVRYVGADKEASITLFNRHYSPAFSIDNGVLNSIYPKSVRTTAPIRYLIVAHGSFRGQLESFVQWKRRKGYLTDIVYTDSAAVGTTATSIAAYVQSQYTNATAANPAPTFLLLVGDHEQVPAFTGTTSSEHITDLYYISWTAGDNIPDCYCGRFSAQNAGQLTPQIEKTLMYEQYTFADPSFLDRAVLVAGVDGGNSGDYGYSHADPAMDYAATHYVNTTQGFSQVHYFKNNTSIVPTAPGVVIGSSASSNSATVRNYYNQGAGWINYSAHGSATSWGTPNFTTSHINTMTNTQKFGLMIGNCCLTNKFENTTCFGEALLRKNNYCGAVGYIGGSNSTYWYEDFYWAVGLRSSIGPSMSMAYNAANLGAYDRLCHTHGEAYSNWVLTQGGVMMAGNMAVEGSTSSRKLYYWEIYHLMGDPSVMPYLTQASLMAVTAPSFLVRGATTLSVSAVPYAYVALTDTLSHTLIASAYADNAGVAVLALPPSLPVGGYELAASAQQYRTSFTPLSVVSPSGAYPVVAETNALMPLDAGDTVPVAFTLVNLGDSTAYNVSFTAVASDTTALAFYPAGVPVDSLQPGDSVSVVWHAIVGQSVEDGTVLPVTFSTVWSGSSVPNTAVYSWVLNAPNISFDIAVGDGNILPGQGDTLIALLVNNGHATLDSCSLMLSSPTRLLSVGTGEADSSSLFSLMPGDAILFTFPIHADSLLPSGIEVPLMLSLTQSHTGTTFPLYIGANFVETFEGGVFHTGGWTQGYYPWTIVSSGAYAGNYCLRSSAIGHLQTAEISVPVALTTADSISFYYKVSSEENYDKFHFYIDNTDLVTESGEVGWTRAAFLVPAGSHTLRFTYAKDVSVIRNSDCAWIDNISFPHEIRPAVFRSDHLCVGSSYIIAGDTVNTSEAASGAYVDSSDADTMVFVNYTVHPTYSFADSLVVCDSITWNDSTYFSSTQGELSLQSAFGCDSLVLLHLTVYRSSFMEDSIVGCDSVSWLGTTYTATADFSETLATVNGCDSMTVHHLIVNHSVVDTIYDSISADSYLWNDSTYALPGTYVQYFSTAQGCDSTVVLVLTFENGHQSIPTQAFAGAVGVFPNPTSGQFTIDADRVLGIGVYDNMGRHVATLQGSSQLDISHLPAGTYLLQIRLPNAVCLTKIVKK